MLMKHIFKRRGKAMTLMNLEEVMFSPSKIHPLAFCFNVLLLPKSYKDSNYI